MKHKAIHMGTEGEALYSITDLVRAELPSLIENHAVDSGVLHLFVMHTSCALLISEDWDPTARQDLEAFLKHLAPRHLPFIRHTLEGEDDSPSHMKSAVLQQHLGLIVEEGELLLGQWQGVFLAEFRDHPKERTVLLKFQADSYTETGRHDREEP